MRIIVRRPPPPPDFDALLAEWSRLMVERHCGDGMGGTLGERTCRAQERERRLAEVELMLCEQMWRAS